jgi:hypothetical protein
VLVGSPADWNAWFDPAAAGLIHETTGELDPAISESWQERALNPFGRTRLADAYCLRGSSNQKEEG